MNIPKEIAEIVEAEMEAYRHAYRLKEFWTKPFEAEERVLSAKSEQDARELFTRVHMARAKREASS